MTLTRLNTVSQRSRTLLSNTAQSFAIRGGALLVSMLTLPAYMRYFEHQVVLGLWFTMLSMLAWVLTFDLGIGNGLRNYLVEAFVKEDHAEARQLISSSYVVVGGAALTLAILGHFSLALVPWNTVFNVPRDVVDPSQLLSVVRLLFAGIMAQFVLRLIASVLYAMQRSALPGLLTLASNAAMLAYAVHFHPVSLSGKLQGMAMAFVVTSNVPALLATILVFSLPLRGCAPSPRLFDRLHAIKVMKLGGVFFWLQIMTLLIFNTNEILISWFVSPEKVVEFQIYNKVFGLVSIVFQLALTPVWSAVTEACERGDHAWVLKLYRTLSRAALAAIFAEAVLVVLLQPLVNVWLADRTVPIRTDYAIACAASATVFIWMSVNAALAAGIGELRTPMVFLTLGALTNLPIAYGLTLLTHSWIAIVLANILSMMPYSIFQPLRLHNHLRKAMSKVKNCSEEVPA